MLALSVSAKEAPVGAAVGVPDVPGPGRQHPRQRDVVSGVGDRAQALLEVADLLRLAASLLAAEVRGLFSLAAGCGAGNRSERCQQSEHEQQHDRGATTHHR